MFLVNCLTAKYRFTIRISCLYTRYVDIIIIYATITGDGLYSVKEIDLNTYRRILLFGGSGTGKTAKAKEIVRKVKRSDPSVKALVISPNSEYRDVAEELGLAYLEPERLGLDPIKLYKENVIGSCHIKKFMNTYLGLSNVEVDELPSISDVDRSRVYEGERPNLKGDMVLSLAKFGETDLTKAGFFIPFVLSHEILFGNMSDTLMVLDGMDRFLDGMEITDLMNDARKFGNAILVTVRSPHRFGSNNDVMNILSVSDVVFVFNISDSLDLEILSDFFRLDREDIDEIRELKPGESMLIVHRKI